MELARYVEALTMAGKRVYPLPMYVNAALNRPGRVPGEYPSGGPLPHLIDIWKAGAPSLDLLAPDIYFRNFTDIVSRYDRPDNGLFIPEQGRASMSELTAGACVSALFGMALVWFFFAERKPRHVIALRSSPASRFSYKEKSA